VAAIALLAGCGGAGGGGHEKQAVAAGGAAAGSPAPASKAKAPAAAALTAEGFGPLRIGMSGAEVVEALGEDSDPQAVGGPDPESCDEFRPERAPEGMLVMIEAGRLTRISLIEGSKVATDRGVRVGDPASAVRSAYGAALRSGAHKYEEAPAGYLTVWTKAAPGDERSPVSPAARGIRFDIGASGQVQSISAGGPSIEYVEGCA
jgi:hypothetical protein